VLLDVVVPGRLDDEQRELAERLDETLSGDNLGRDGRERAGFFGRRRRG
jgi:hypothetical protein